MSTLRSLLRRRNLRHFLPPEPRNFIRRSRMDFAGLGNAASHRDRDVIVEDLKAEEEPEFLPIRKQDPNPVLSRTTVAVITGYEFLDCIRDEKRQTSAPRHLHSMWSSMEIDFDYDRVRPEGFMFIDSNGVMRIQAHAKCPLSHWTYFAIHLMHHLALGIVEPPANYPDRALWMLAAETIVNRHVAGTSFIAAPPGFPKPAPNQNGGSLLNRINRAVKAKFPETPEEQIDEWHAARVSCDTKNWMSPAGTAVWDVIDLKPEVLRRFRSLAVLDRVKLMEPRAMIQRSRYGNETIERAYRWVSTNFPLLSAVTDQFEIDYENYQAYNIALAAVSARDQVIFVNPVAELSELEWRWVLIHEILHVVLEHQRRLGDRHHLLWNVACDYVINNWLEQMGVGMRPQGVLFKPDYQGRDAESIYDELVQNGGNDQLKLVTLRGEGMGDIMDFDRGYNLPPRLRNRFAPGARQTVQNAARQMLEDAQNGIGRGDLPGDLVEELDLGELLKEQIEVPQWKAELANWLDLNLAPRAPRRSYVRLSRRQASTSIPMPGRAKIDFHSPTFGVVLDTSGSMSHQLLQQGLSAVVGFAAKNGVLQIRLIMCDTRPFDEGFVPLDTLQKPVKIYGRGGTVLQPAVTLLQEADDFPNDAPILIVTDGQIDILTVEREHAYLMPGHANLPFEPDGPVFKILGNNNSFGRFARRSTPPPPSQPRPTNSLADTNNDIPDWLKDV